MNKSLIAMLSAAGMALSGVAIAQTQRTTTPAPAMSKADYNQALKDADAQYKSAKDACKSLSGNAKDICLAEAAGKQKVAKADAEAAYKNTPKARENARITKAEADYKVAAEKCDDLSGNPKDVCVKEAKAALVKAKADAKVDRVATDTNRDAASTQAAARKDANEEKREAQLKVAMEKCDAMASTAKDSCVTNAKAQYGKH